MDIIEDEFFDEEPDFFLSAICFFKYISDFYEEMIGSEKILAELDIECFVSKFSDLRKDNRSVI